MMSSTITLKKMNPPAMRRRQRNPSTTSGSSGPPVNQTDRLRANRSPPTADSASPRHACTAAKRLIAPPKIAVRKNAQSRKITANHGWSMTRPTGATTIMAQTLPSTPPVPPPSSEVTPKSRATADPMIRPNPPVQAAHSAW